MNLEAIADGREGRHFMHREGTLPPLQRWELYWPASDVAAQLKVPISPGEAATCLWRDLEYSASTNNSTRFQVYVHDAHPGLSEEDALLAKRAFLLRLEERPKWAHDRRADFNTRQSVVRSGRSSWVINSTRWQSRLIQSYRGVAEVAFAANMRVEGQLKATPSNRADGEGQTQTQQCNKEVWSTPVVVMNLPGNHARRQSSSQLLKSVGFSNVSFPQVLAWSDIEEERLVSEGMLSRFLFSRLRHSRGGTGEVGLKKYVANALTQILSVRAAAAANEPVIILEDDLMASALDQTLRDRICRTLSNIPPTADMVFLEYCFETCSLLSYDARYPLLARAFEPSCSAAIYFTANGARRVATLAFPVFDVIDTMYPHLIRKGWLEAYVMQPPAFFQNHMFGSTWNHPGKIILAAFQDNCHQPQAAIPACVEIYMAPPGSLGKLQHTDLRQIGIVLHSAEFKNAMFLLESSQACRDAHAATVANDHSSFMYLWLMYPVFKAWTDACGSQAGDWVEYSICNRFADRNCQVVGNLTLGSKCGALLKLSSNSSCLGTQGVDEACEITTSIQRGVPGGRPFASPRVLQRGKEHEKMVYASAEDALCAGGRIVTWVYLKRFFEAFGAGTPPQCESTSETCGASPVIDEGNVHESLHGNNHPAVSIKFGNPALVYMRDYKGVLMMKLILSIVGCVEGFQYLLRVQVVERAALDGSVRHMQIWERRVAGVDRIDLNASFSIPTDEKQKIGDDSTALAHRVFVDLLDEYPGLSHEEKIVSLRIGEFVAVNAVDRDSHYQRMVDADLLSSAPHGHVDTYQDLFFKHGSQLGQMQTYHRYDTHTHTHTHDTHARSHTHTHTHTYTHTRTHARMPAREWHLLRLQVAVGAALQPLATAW